LVTTCSKILKCGQFCYIPSSHWNPSPLYPSVHSQWKEPSVLMHSALSSQGPDSTAYSSTSFKQISLWTDFVHCIGIEFFTVLSSSRKYFIHTETSLLSEKNYQIYTYVWGSGVFIVLCLLWNGVLVSLV
jgi:hypothetical protein